MTDLKVYKLLVKRDGQWSELAIVRAPDHSQAFRKAMMLLSPELFSVPIRLEQVTEEEDR